MGRRGRVLGVMVGTRMWIRGAVEGERLLGIFGRVWEGVVGSEGLESGIKYGYALSRLVKYSYGAT